MVSHEVFEGRFISRTDDRFATPAQAQGWGGRESTTSYHGTLSVVGIIHSEETE